MTPEQIITRIDSTENGCESCQWYGWNNNAANRKRICDASRDAFPNGSKAACIGWYKPKTKRGNGRGWTTSGGGR